MRINNHVLQWTGFHSSPIYVSYVYAVCAPTQQPMQEEQVKHTQSIGQADGQLLVYMASKAL